MLSLGKEHGSLGIEEVMFEPSPGVNKKLSLVAQTVKNLPAMQGTPVQFLSWEDPPEKGTATDSSMASHFSILGLPLWLSW